MATKKTPNKAMPKGKTAKGGYSAAKGPKGKAKVTGKKPAIKSRKSKIEEAVKKIKF